MIQERKWPNPRGIGASDPGKIDCFPGRGNRRSLINLLLTPALSLRERELVVGGATAPTLAMVSRGESFDSTGGVGAIAPHPSPLPEGEGASSWRRHGPHAGHRLSPQPSPRGEGASGDENPSL